ncbi:MAG TPA: hypothetical protein PLS70_19940, partial [Acidobacteriota bacterium]|nr:hypothetical protein [Acidobacteriota bacterium]
DQSSNQVSKPNHLSFLWFWRPFFGFVFFRFLGLFPLAVVPFGHGVLHVFLIWTLTGTRLVERVGSYWFNDEPESALQE